AWRAISRYCGDEENSCRNLVHEGAFLLWCIEGSPHALRSAGCAEIKGKVQLGVGRSDDPEVLASAPNDVRLTMSALCWFSVDCEQRSPVIYNQMCKDFLELGCEGKSSNGKDWYQSNASERILFLS